MKAATICLALGLLLMAGTTFSDSGKGKILGTAGPAVTRLIEEYEEAHRAENLELLSELFAHDDRIVMISSLPGPWMVGWEKVKEGYANFFELTECKEISHDPKLLRVNSAATHAWVSGLQDAEFEYQGKVHRFERTRFTWALEKQEGKWRIVQAHWSSPRELETAEVSP